MAHTREQMQKQLNADPEAAPVVPAATQNATVPPKPLETPIFENWFDLGESNTAGSLSRTSGLEAFRSFPAGDQYSVDQNELEDLPELEDDTTNFSSGVGNEDEDLERAFRLSLGFSPEASERKSTAEKDMVVYTPAKPEAAPKTPKGEDAAAKAPKVETAPLNSITSPTSLQSADPKSAEQKDKADTNYTSLLRGIPQKLLKFWFTSEGRGELFGFIDYADIKAAEVKQRADLVKTVLTDKTFFTQVRDAIKMALSKGQSAKDFISKEDLDSQYSFEMESNVSLWRRQYSTYIREAEKQFSGMGQPSASVLGHSAGQQLKPSAPPRAVPISFEDQMRLALEESLKDQPKTQGPGPASKNETGQKQEIKVKAEDSATKNKELKTQQETISLQAITTEESELLSAMEASRLAYEDSLAACGLSAKIGASIIGNIDPVRSQRTAGLGEGMSLGGSRSAQSQMAYNGFGLPLGLSDVAAGGNLNTPQKPVTIAEQKKTLEAKILELKATIANAETKLYTDSINFRKQKTTLEESMEKRLATLQHDRNHAEAFYKREQQRNATSAVLSSLASKVGDADKAYETFVRESQQKLKDLNRLEKTLEFAKHTILSQRKTLEGLKVELQKLEDLALTTYSTTLISSDQAVGALTTQPGLMGLGSPSEATSKETQKPALQDQPRALSLGPVAAAVASVLEPIPSLPADLYSPMSDNLTGNRFDFSRSAPKMNSAELDSKLLQDQMAALEIMRQRETAAREEAAKYLQIVADLENKMKSGARNTAGTNASSLSLGTTGASTNVKPQKAADLEDIFYTLDSDDEEDSLSKTKVRR